MAFLLSACGQDYNSNTGDKRYGNSVIPAAGACDGDSGARYCAAQAVITKRCFGCHADWEKFDTEAKWRDDSGRVEAGNTSHSSLYKRLLNSGGDMPQGGPALPSGEYAVISDWITKMTSAAQGAL